MDIVSASAGEKARRQSAENRSIGGGKILSGVAAVWGGAGSGRPRCGHCATSVLQQYLLVVHRLSVSKYVQSCMAAVRSRYALGVGLFGPRSKRDRTVFQRDGKSAETSVDRLASWCSFLCARWPPPPTSLFGNERRSGATEAAAARWIVGTNPTVRPTI